MNMSRSGRMGCQVRRRITAWQGSFTFHVSRIIFSISLGVILCAQRVLASDAADPVMQIPLPGDYALHVLTPRLLELVNVNTKASGQSVNNWNWVNGTELNLPDLSSIRVIVNGQMNNVTGGVGFRRRPIYAPQAVW